MKATGGIIMDDYRKPVVMHHCVMPGQLGGPNIVMERIMKSSLAQKYDFRVLEQKRVAGGKVNLGLVLELANVIRTTNPDILHVSGLQSAGFHCLCAGKLAGCKRIVLTIHGFSGDAIELSSLKRWVFNKFIEPFTLYAADAVIGNSQYTISRNMVIRYARNLRGHIYNLTPAPYIKTPTKLSFRHELGIADDEVLIVTAARVVRDKGFLELAEAIKVLRDVPSIRFLVIGIGDYLEKFKSIVKMDIEKKRVLLLGVRNDLQRILASSDIFVLPSWHETLSNVTMEAAIEGLAIIVSDTGGLREIISHNMEGLLIDVGDSMSLARSIRYLVEKPCERKRLGANAYSKMQLHFAHDDIINRIDCVYQELMVRIRGD